MTGRSETKTVAPRRERRSLFSCAARPAERIRVNLTDILPQIRAKPFYHLSLWHRHRNGLREKTAGCRPASVEPPQSQGKSLRHAYSVLKRIQRHPTALPQAKMRPRPWRFLPVDANAPSKRQPCRYSFERCRGSLSRRGRRRGSLGRRALRRRSAFLDGR